MKVGCCGFARARAEYFAHLALVEVQQTFYKPPQVETAQRWRAEAPSDFEFTLKAWQLITHEPGSPTYRKAQIEVEEPNRYGAFRPTAEVFAAWERTREIAAALGAKIVVFQCPASFRPTEEHKANMRAFFGSIQRGGLILAWEPRGPWGDDEVRELCVELGLVHCVDPFQRQPVRGEPAYFRLHGIGGYRYRYTNEDLATLLEWCRPYGETYCLFNNVSMWDDALRFKEVTGNEGRPHTLAPG